MSEFLDFSAAVRAARPQVAVVLGSGLGGVPHRFEERAAVPFAAVPGMVAPAIAGHAGSIALGSCDGQPLLVFRGRVHLYEGHSRDRVAASVGLAAELEVRIIILTNAAGGIHTALNPGDLMVVRDHLSLQTPDSWKKWVAGRPPSPYSPRLVELVQGIERAAGRELLAGVYAAVTGPCYETPAEIRALRAAGADAVGMSTAHEAAIAASLGLECLAISTITNKAAGLALGTLDHREVLANAAKPAERISEILEKLLSEFS